MLNVGLPGASTLCTMRRRIAVFSSLAIGFVLTVVAQAAPGNPDATFGLNGLVAPLFLGVANSRADGMLIQPDGKVVVSGGCGLTTVVICVARRLPNGAPDPDFGTQGTVVTADQIGTNGYTIKIVMQPGGKLVISTTCDPVVFCAIRLNSNGTRDLTFGMAGKATVTTRINAAFTQAFAEQRDGKLVFAGYCIPTGAPTISLADTAGPCAARINANGSPDTSFGIDGVVFVAPPAAIEAGASTTLAAVSEQADGMLVLSGKCRLLAAPPLPLANAPCAFRRLSNGAPDPSYGNNGFTATRIVTDDSFVVGAAAVQLDDAVVIGGSCGFQERKACIVRFDKRGQHDAWLQTSAAPALFVRISALDPQPDGKILAVGQCSLPLISGDRNCFLRYNSDGSPDASLPLVVGEILQASGRSIATQIDGKIVVAGDYVTGSKQAVSLDRYEGGPFGTATCSLDIDGDGVMNPAIDGVILTRATMGFSGPNVYAGITFAANATRTQWGTGGSDDIRKFLVSQCGLKLN